MTNRNVVWKWMPTSLCPSPASFGATRRKRWLITTFLMGIMSLLILHFGKIEASASQVPLTSAPKRHFLIRKIPRAGASVSAFSSTGKTAVEPLSYYLRVALAGGVAGATGSAILFPLDSTKTLRQTPPETYSSVQKLPSPK